MEYIFSVISIVLFSIMVYKMQIIREPINFEPNEKYRIRNKWFVWYIIRAIFGTLNSFSECFFVENSSQLFWYIIDILLYGSLVYLFSTNNKHIFKLIYVLIPLETLAMAQNSASVSYELYFYTILYFFIWEFPNYVYFIKRRNLFSTNITENSTNFDEEIIEPISTESYQFTNSDDSIGFNSTNVVYTKSNKEILPNISNVLHISTVTLYVIASISSSIFYIYTLYILFVNYGFWQGFVGMCLPIISSVYLCIKEWIIYGFHNGVTEYGVIIMALFVAGFIFNLISYSISSGDD